MVVQNNDYIKCGSDRAVEQNSLLLNCDKNLWFYKKWRGLTACSGSMEKKENRLEKRLKDIKDIYRHFYEIGDIPYPTSVAFAKYKKQFGKEDDTLMEVLRRLPKGGLLHVHSAAALSVEELLNLLETWEGPAIYIVIRSDNGLKGKLTYTPPADIGEDEGKSEVKMPLRDFLGLHGAAERLKKWLTVGEHTDWNPYIWDEFNKIFMRTSDLFENREFYFEYHRRFFLECLRDRIDYVELRCGFQNFVYEGNDVQEHMILDLSPDFLEELVRAKDAAVAEYQGNVGKYKWILPFQDMGLGVILCARRDLDPRKTKDKEKLMKKIDTAIVWKKGERYSRLIKGFDFVSEEDRGMPSYAYYRDIFYGEALSGYEEGSEAENVFSTLRREHKMEGCSRVELIELMLHAGESLWMEQENILDAKIVSKNRIGHGFQLLEYPGALMEYIFETRGNMIGGPALEVCPISNQMLRYFPDIRNHYALILMKLGVPCVLSNDDPQILGNPGLSYDFWEIYMAADGGLMMIKGLVFTAFVFQYQDRCGKSLNEWNNEEYNDCLQMFNDWYWEPFLEEMEQYFSNPDGD